MIALLVLNKKSPLSTKLWIGINSILAISLSFISGVVIPEQFLRDSVYYDELLSSSISGFSGPVTLIGKIYSFIGVNAPGITLRLVSTIIFILNAYLIFNYFELKIIRKSQYFLVALSFVLIPFYGSGYSKELLVAITNIVMVTLAYRFKKAELAIFPIISIFIGLTLRPYYFLTLIYFIFVYFTLKNIRNTLGRLFSILVSLSGLITFEFHTNFIFRSTGFEILNVRSNSQSILKIAARSQIEAVDTNGNFLHNFFAVIQVIRSMILPYNDFFLSPYQLAALGINAAVWMIVVRCLQLLVNQENSRNLPVASFILAFVMTATFFEVDAGSFLRHFYPFMPLGAIILQSRRDKDLKDSFNRTSKARIR